MAANVLPAPETLRPGKNGENWKSTQQIGGGKKSVFNAQTLFSYNYNNNSTYRAGLAYREGRQLKIVQVAMKERMVVGHPSPKKKHNNTHLYTLKWSAQPPGGAAVKNKSKWHQEKYQPTLYNNSRDKVSVCQSSLPSNVGRLWVVWRSPKEGLH